MLLEGSSQLAQQETAASALSAHLRPQRTLLLLDNLEHLSAAGPLLIELLGSAPGLTLLVTSRALLRVSGEQVVPVPPLALPDPGPPPPAAGLERFGAVRLFLERARAVHPAFVVDDQNVGDVVAICRRLDGLPLAIELAAARINVVPPRPAGQAHAPPGAADRRGPGPAGASAEPARRDLLEL